MKEQEQYFFEPQSLAGRKKHTRKGKISKFADTVFETKVLKSRRNRPFRNSTENWGEFQIVTNR